MKLLSANTFFMSSIWRLHDFEMLMEIKDRGEVVRIYTTGNEKTVTQFILTAAEYDAFTFICLDGTMSRADLEKAIAKATQQME